jgi:hypothetical protein
MNTQRSGKNGSGVGFIFLCILLLQLRMAGSAVAQQVTGHEDFHVTLPDAMTFTKSFQTVTQKDSVIAEYIGKDAVLSVLQQSRCVGLRLYRGINNGMLVTVIAGIDSLGRDLTAGPLLEHGLPCPPFCDTNHILSR